MSDTWGALPFLGSVAHFHTDPAEGGPPLASIDGHWWWDGHGWVALPEAVAAPDVRVARAGLPA